MSGKAREGLLSVPIPIEPRKRSHFVLFAPDVPVDMPFLADLNGRLQCRFGCGFIRERRRSCRQMDSGSTFVVSLRPTKEEDAATNHTDGKVDYDIFEKQILPLLVKRVQGFETAKVSLFFIVSQKVFSFLVEECIHLSGGREYLRWLSDHRRTPSLHQSPYDGCFRRKV